MKKSLLYVAALAISGLMAMTTNAFYCGGDLGCVAKYVLPKNPDGKYQTETRGYHEWAPVSGFVTAEDKRIVMKLRFDGESLRTLQSMPYVPGAWEARPLALEIDICVPGEEVKFLDGDSAVSSTFPSNSYPIRDTDTLNGSGLGCNGTAAGLLIRDARGIEKDKDYHVFFNLDRRIPDEGIRITPTLQISGDMAFVAASYGSSLMGDSASKFNFYVLETESYVSGWKVYPEAIEGVCWNDKNDSFRCVSESPSHPTPAVVPTPQSVGARAVTRSAPIKSFGVTALPETINVAPELLPDFLVKNVRIYTSGSTETYIYGNLETHKVKAQFANVGDRDADSRPITVHTYRSKGYKEDQHGDWVHVATNTIQGQNLKKDETHTETATIALKGLTPGIYNYVSCIDHPKTEQNNGGDHQEKHESNNCSTEAVFEVKEGVVNQPNVDLTISQVMLNTNPVYAGYPMSASLWVRNIGTETPTATSRAAYYVSGPGTSNQWQLIADDEVLASELTPGRDQGESIKSPVPAPSIPGSYQLMACADYLNQVLETNKANNCLVTPFTIQTLPAPILSITKFQDEEGCCTTNTGSRIKPNIWVKNSGPVAPATNVQVVYHLSSPVATGNQWVYIGYGIIEPRELPPGKTDEDYMEGSGFTIPKDNAWKLQWHQVRACIKPDGSAPSGDPSKGDICATYQRYSKK